jgi:HEAT repeat protein
MLRPTRSALRFSSTLALALVFTSTWAQSQVVLPEGTPGGKPNTDAGAKSKERKAEDPRVLPDTSRGFNGRKQEGGLELPAERPRPVPSTGGTPTAAPEVAPTPAPIPTPAPTPTPALPTDANAATYVLAEVAKLRDVGSPTVESAALSLLRMGEVGRAAALGALESEHAPTCVVGLRMLLRSPASGDAERALARIEGKLPTGATAAAVDSLCELDPVRASSERLAGLLMHRQTPVRVAAQRHLAKLGPALPLAALEKPLAHKEPDTRLRAVQLVDGCADPRSVAVLLEKLGDPNGSVARRALDSLAQRNESEIDAELVRRAFAERGILRRGAYALLALCEREDRRIVATLGEAHAPLLLEGLGSKDPFVAGASACALAGIGFRSSEGLDSAWLDLEVPHRLVRAISAEDFSPDFSSLVPTAVRRLHLITGQNFGSDGPRWIEWWSATAQGFRAYRAAMSVRMEDAGSLELTLVDELAKDGAELRLVGATRATELDAKGQLAPATLILTEAQARGLWDVLQRGRVFSAERLPGGRGSSFEAGRSLTVECAGRAKSFRFAGAGGETWFTATVDSARALAQRNRWQLFPEPGVSLGRLALWKAESPVWEVLSDEPARALWQRVRQRAAKLPLAERDAAVAELARIEAQTPCASPEDFGTLVSLLRDERFFGARARSLLELAMQSASAGQPVLPASAAAELVDVWVAGLGLTAPEELARVFARAGRDFTLACAADERPFVRAVAAAALVREPGERELAVLRRLLDDAEPRVQAAALLALGEARVRTATSDVQARVRNSNVEVRCAALRALGRLGGDAALGTLLAALSDAEPKVRVAAAEGMTSLEDPGTVPLLVSLLAKGPEDVTYEPARRGLLSQGERAWNELLRLVRSPASKSRREAALLLSEQLVPQVVSPLLTLLSEEPGDARVAEELAVLSCVDYRSQSNASAAWWAWWEDVVHDDPQAWLCAASGRLGITPCEPVDVRAGTAVGLAFLDTCARREEAWLCERARRELTRLAGRDIGPLPPRGRQRDLWLSTLREQLAARTRG